MYLCIRVLSKKIPSICVVLGSPAYLSIIIPSICVLCIMISLQVYSPPLICYLMPSFPVIEPLCPISPEKKEGDQLSQDLAQWSQCASTRYKVQDTMVQMCKGNYDSSSHYLVFLGMKD